MRHDKQTMNEQRKILAIIGFVLPIISVAFGLPFIEKNGPTFWHSISATYYATSGDLMRGALSIFGFFLMCYMGYDLGDRLTCSLSGLFAWGIVVFPCKCDAAGETTGIFNLPTPISHIVHCICAALLFGSFAYMIGLRFTKSNCVVTTYEKVVRNRIYRTCALIIVTVMAFQVLTSLLKITWFTIINETVMLWSFSFAWAVKSNLIKRWSDV